MSTVQNDRERSAIWQNILDRNEQIVWQGRPSGRMIIRPSDIPVILFGVFFGGFALFWIAMTRSITGDPQVADDLGAPISLFPLFGLPFLAIGVYIAVGRFFWDAWKRRRSFYTLSNRRAFIGTEIMGQRKLQTYDLKNPPRLELVQEKGLSTVWFAEKSYGSSARYGKNARRKYNTPVYPVGFELIQDGPEVFRLIRESSDIV